MSKYINNILVGTAGEFSQYTLPTLYKAVRSNSFGISEEGGIIYGLTLVVVVEAYGEDDWLSEDIMNFGAEAIIVFPAEGLQEGAIYSTNFVVTDIDRDSGYVDEWEIHIIKEMN